LHKTTPSITTESNPLEEYIKEAKTWITSTQNKTSIKFKSSDPKNNKLKFTIGEEIAIFIVVVPKKGEDWVLSSEELSEDFATNALTAVIDSRNIKDVLKAANAAYDTLDVAEEDDGEDVGEDMEEDDGLGLAAPRIEPKKKRIRR